MLVRFVLGVAMLGGGAALYFLAPEQPERQRSAFYVTPSLSPDSVGVVLGGKL